MKNYIIVYHLQKDKKKGKKEKDASKLSLLSNELNDIQNDVKESMKNIINNVTEMQDLDDKSEKIKDVSFQFQKDSSMLERKMRYKKGCPVEHPFLYLTCNKLKILI